LTQVQTDSYRGKRAIFALRTTYQNKLITNQRKRTKPV
jgi:hypothetical protein